MYLTALGLSCSTQHLQSSLWHTGSLVVPKGRDIVPWPAIEPRPAVLGARSLCHWTTREAPQVLQYLFHLSCSSRNVDFINREMVWICSLWRVSQFVTFSILQRQINDKRPVRLTRAGMSLNSTWSFWLLEGSSDPWDLSSNTKSWAEWGRAQGSSGPSAQNKSRKWENVGERSPRWRHMGPGSRRGGGCWEVSRTCVSCLAPPYTEGEAFWTLLWNSYLLRCWTPAILATTWPWKRENTVLQIRARRW